MADVFFRYAVAFILLHELAHLYLGHTECEGAWSIHQEKEADRFAADWLLDCDSLTPKRTAKRINRLAGITVALLWLTISNVYFGRHESNTHPESYDRLFQVLDNAVNRDDQAEYLLTWDLAERLLFAHMDNAGFAFDQIRMQGDPRVTTSYLVDLLSQR